MTILRNVMFPGLMLALASAALQGQAVPKPGARLQTEVPAPSNNSTIPAPAVEAPTEPAVNPGLEGQAPDEMTRKITALVHEGKYAEAQKLTDGLLIAYPNDRRLMKAKTLIERMLAPVSSTSAAPIAGSMSSNAEELSGMDKVDYNALIVLARQAQQTTDSSEQKKLLNQFMDQSSLFLQKHSGQMLVWQLRAASAISLNQPMEGYEAGQALIAAGAADSNDPAMQNLIGQLKNKGWLDKHEAEVQASKKRDYVSILGTWRYRLSTTDHKGHEIAHADWTLEFSKSDSALEGYVTKSNGKKESMPWLRGTILDSGEITWERHWGSSWKPVSVDLDSDRRAMKVVFIESIAIGQNAFNTKGYMEPCSFNNSLTKN
jgi:hypothetical protein